MENIKSKQSRGVLFTSILIFAFITFFIQSIISLVGMMGSTFLTFLEVAVTDESDQFIGPFFYFLLLLITGITGLVGSSSIWKLKRSGVNILYISTIISIASFWGLNGEFIPLIILYLIFILTIYISRNKLN